MAVDTLKVLHTFRHAPLVATPDEMERASLRNMDNLNCTKDDVLPSARDLWDHVHVIGFSLFAIAAFLTLFVSACFCEVSIYIRRHVHHPHRRTFLYFIAGLYSVLCWSSICGILVPRAAVLTDLVASAYLSLCLYFFFGLVSSYYGEGRKRDVHARLSRTEATRTLSLRSPPLCCCCFCLPLVVITPRVLKVLSIMVLQVSIITPLVAWISGILLMDGSYVDEYNTANSANLYLSIILAISTITAMYSLTLFNRVSQVCLTHRAIRIKMVSLQVCLIMTNLQPIIFSTLATYDVIPCTPPLSSQARGRALHLFILIIEMTLLSLATRRFWRVKDTEIRVIEVEEGKVNSGIEGLEEDRNRTGTALQLQGQSNGARALESDTKL